MIFVEGHSSDGTWEEIQRLTPEYKSHFRLVSLQQEGRGKGDAVRLGFAKATGDLLTILDADLTVSPDFLGRFLDAYRRGHGDLVNGSRLVYGSEDEAMRSLNRVGNVLFAKALSYVLSIRLGDSLCGTKLLGRHDYSRFTAWRTDFGDFDPFGDFELLFPAAVLGLTVVDVPVRYDARRSCRRVWLITDARQVTEFSAESARRELGSANFGLQAVVRANQIREALAVRYGPPDTTVAGHGRTARYEQLRAFLFTPDRPCTPIGNPPATSITSPEQNERAMRPQS